MKRRGIFESVGALQQSIRSRGEIAYSFSPEAEASLMRMQNNFVALRPMLVIGRNQLAAIVDSVRTKVLDWSLALEQEGILGDGLRSEEHTSELQSLMCISYDVLGLKKNTTNTENNSNTITII